MTVQYAYCDEAVKLIQSFESCLAKVSGKPGYFKPYRCPANVPTIGWGNTRYPNGKRVTMADEPIDQETCNTIFASELREDEASLRKYLTYAMHELMKGSVGSFAYNCGVGAYAHSGLKRAIDARNYTAVPAAFAVWRMGGGRVLAGLVRRRTAEAAMFMRGVALMKQGAPLVPIGNSPPISGLPNLPGESSGNTSIPAPAAIPLWRRISNWILR
jgi:lysozyme